MWGPRHLAQDRDWHQPSGGRSQKVGAGTRGLWLLALGSPARGHLGPTQPEQFLQPPLVGACTLPAAELPLQALRSMLVRQLRPPCPGAGGHLLRAALSGQTSCPTPQYLCGHSSNKPKALCYTEG